MEVSAGGKRPAEEGGGLEVREVKKAKGVVQSVKKVAEMVLVLAAMGKMRGGRLPSEVERELMAEAREKLAEVCEAFSPKDVFPRDAFGSVIDDLGFSKLKEQQRLGFRPPKISIAEKLLLSKRKFQMDRSEEFTLSPANSSQRMQRSSATAVESRGTSHPARVSPLERPSHVPISSASLQPAALGHLTATNSASLPYQLPTSEIRPIAPSPLLSSHAVKDSSATLPRVDRTHFRVDGRPNGSSHTSQAQVQAHSSGNHVTVKTPTWSVQPQSMSSSNMVSNNKVSMHASQVEGAGDVKSGVPPQPATSQPLVTQSATGNPPIVPQNIQVMNFVQAPPTRNTHAEIGKIIQKLLHPRHPERTAWTPQSKDYMSIALTCQICQSSTTEVENVLVCDNCEKGFHLKCLQTTHHKGGLKVEWHCLRCLSLSNGKPLPPKYGRVMRNISTAKVSSNMASVRPDRKSGTVDEKVNPQKFTANGNIAMQNAPTGPAGNSSSQPTSDSKLVHASAMQVREILSGRGKVDDKNFSGTQLNDSSSTARSTSSPNSSCEKINEEQKPVELKPKLVNSETTPTPSTSNNLQARGNQHSKDQVGQPSDIELPSNQSIENHCMLNDRMKSCGRETPQSNSTDDPKRDEQGAVRVNPAETPTTTSGDTEIAKSSSDSSSAVSWVGDVFQIVEEKTYYQSCCINGVVYKIHDHVLVRFGNGKLIPSKLQAMWEDSGTRIKWVFVNRCYFPSDLPEAVGRPCGLESNEVYESVCGSRIMACFIQGPCEVLPPNKFAAEKERRAHLGTVADDGLRPCYLCKWIYDESKGLFRDISC